MSKNNGVKVETTKTRLGTRGTAVSRYVNVALEADDRRIADALIVELERAGGKWSRGPVVRQALRLLAQHLGVDAPEPVLPARQPPARPSPPVLPASPRDIRHPAPYSTLDPAVHS